MLVRSDSISGRGKSARYTGEYRSRRTITFINTTANRTSAYPLAITYPCKMCYTDNNQLIRETVWQRLQKHGRNLTADGEKRIKINSWNQIDFIEKSIGKRLKQRKNKDKDILNQREKSIIGDIGNNIHQSSDVTHNPVVFVHAKKYWICLVADALNAVSMIGELCRLTISMAEETKRESLLNHHQDIIRWLKSQFKKVRESIKSCALTVIKLNYTNRQTKRLRCYPQCQILRRISAIPLSPKGGSLLANRL